MNIVPFTNIIEEYLKEFRADTIFAVAELLWRGVSVERVHEITKITELFLETILDIVKMEKELSANKNDADVLLKAKKLGFCDQYIAKLWETTEFEGNKFRKENNIKPVYKMVDTLYSGAYIPYFYSTYTGENQSILTDKNKAVVLGSGPIRIGQGVEFDYSTVHAVKTIKESGLEAIIINNNPETVSTDYTVSDKLYFEPLTAEDVMNVIEFENPMGVVTSLGGQTAINLAEPIMERGAKIIGTDCNAINNAEDRDAFEKIMNKLGIPQPKGQAVFSVEDGVKVAEQIGYPVLVRPSYVLGGRAMQIVGNEDALRQYLKTAVDISEDHPILVDKYIVGKELEIDAVCDGKDVFIPGIMELIERTGIHSGDSISVYPTFSVSQKVKDTILDYGKKLGLGIGIVGLYNIQFIVDKNEDVYVIEVNPRSSRTVPFLSNSTGYSLADIGTRVILGKSLKEQGLNMLYPEEKKRWYVKVPAFSFNKLKGLDAYLSPEMKLYEEKIRNSNSVCMHIRRGDYLTVSEVYGGICTPEYYGKAMNQMKEWEPDCHFFIFTNDVVWAKENYQGDEITIVEGNSEDTGYIDLYLMTKCRHYILANSSFSWWGCYLGTFPGKRVIAPKQWFNGRDCSDIYTDEMRTRI